MERRYLACMSSAGNDRVLTRHICCLQGLQSGKWAWAELCLADIVWQWREEAWFSLHHVNLLNFWLLWLQDFYSVDQQELYFIKCINVDVKKFEFGLELLSLYRQALFFLFFFQSSGSEIAHFTFNISRVLVFCKSKAKVIYLQELSGKQLSIALLLSVESDVT